MNKPKLLKYQYTLVSNKVKTEAYKALIEHLTKLNTDVALLFRDTSKYLSTGIVVMSVNYPMNLYSDVATLLMTLERMSLLIGNFENSSYFKITDEEKTTTYKPDNADWKEHKVEFNDGRVIFEEVRPNKHGLIEYFIMDVITADAIPPNIAFQFKEKYGDIVMFGMLEQNTTYENGTALSININTQMPSEIPEPESLDSTVIILNDHYKGIMDGGEVKLLRGKWLYHWTFKNKEIVFNKQKALPDNNYEDWELGVIDENKVRENLHNSMYSAEQIEGLVKSLRRE